MNRLRLVRRDIASGSETELYPRYRTASVSSASNLTRRPAARFHGERGSEPTEADDPFHRRGHSGHPVSRRLRQSAASGRRVDPRWKHILFKAEDGRQRTRVWAVPSDGGEARKLDLSTEGIGKMDLSPDGTQLVFTGTKRKQELWMIKNLLPSHASRK